MNIMNQLKIKKETKKALLLEKDGVEFWVMRRWVNDNGLTPAGVKALEKKKKEVEAHSQFWGNFKLWFPEKPSYCKYTREFISRGKARIYLGKNYADIYFQLKSVGVSEGASFSTRVINFDLSQENLEAAYKKVREFFIEKYGWSTFCPELVKAKAA